jgi:hypothetical protein
MISLAMKKYPPLPKLTQGDLSTTLDDALEVAIDEVLEVLVGILLGWIVELIEIKNTILSMRKAL